MNEEQKYRLASKLDTGGGDMGEPPSVWEIAGVLAFAAVVASLVWGAA